jgi:hypothetical protein
MQQTAFPASFQHHGPGLMPQTAAGTYSNGYHTAQHAAPGSSSLAKRFVWLGNCPTCSQCGDRGHEARSCSTPYCDRCSKWGHPPGHCSSACSTCGKTHKSKTCILCKHCGMYRHLSTVCPTVQCSKCMCWGHASTVCIVPQPEGTTPEAAAGASNSSSSDPAAAWALPQPGQLQHAPVAADRVQAHDDSSQPSSSQPQEPFIQPAHIPTAAPGLAYQQGQLAASRADGYTAGIRDPAAGYDSSYDNQRAEYQQPPYQQYQHYAHPQLAHVQINPAMGHNTQQQQQQQYLQQSAAGYHSAQQAPDYWQQQQQQYEAPMQPPPPPQQQQLPPPPPQQPQQQQQQQQVTGDRSSRSYSWLAKIPTCWACGDRGHSADSCPAAVCGVCGKVGHADGLCEQHCTKCGKQHTGKGCKQCKLCGMFGHLSTMCFDAHCNACGCYGHAQQVGFVPAWKCEQC